MAPRALPCTAFSIGGEKDKSNESAQFWSEDLTKTAAATIIGAMRLGESLMVCGDGGSASDARYITNELVRRVLMERRALNVIWLSSPSSRLPMRT
jgi:phosphoheptose isomerase